MQLHHTARWGRIVSALALLVCLSGALAVNAAAQAKGNKRVLFVTQSKGFRHAVLHQAEELVETWGAKNGFDVTITQMAEKYDAR